MKIPAYLFLFFLLVLASCRQQDYSRLLAVADSLMDTRPDSAWQLLRGISPEALPTEGERMRHRLLTLEAECRNGQMPANDSLLLPLIGYFQRGGETFWEARAEYNRGCILYRAQRQFGQALDVFQRVKTLMEQCGNTWWLGRTYGRMAYIYHSQEMYPQADSLYRKAEQLAIQAGDTALWLEALERRSVHLIAQGEEHYREAEKLLLKVCRLAEQVGLTKNLNNSMLTLSQLYSYMQDGTQALRYAQGAWALETDTTGKYVPALLIGDAYYQLNRYDSATVWLENILAGKPALAVRSAACMRLADMAEEQGEPEKALYYQKKYQQVENEMHERSQTTEIRLTEQSQVHRQEQTQMKRLMLICLATIGVLMVCIVLLLGGRAWERKRRRKQMDALMKFWWQEHRALLCMETSAVESPIAETSAAEPEVRLLPLPVEAEERPVLDAESLLDRLRVTELYAKAMRILSHYKLYADYEEHFTVDDQNELLCLIDRFTDGFIARLKAKASLSENDLRFCGLHLLGLFIQHIAVLLEKDRSGVYKRQKRILRNCFHETSDKKFEEVLKSI